MKSTQHRTKTTLTWNKSNMAFSKTYLLSLFLSNVNRLLAYVAPLDPSHSYLGRFPYKLSRRQWIKLYFTVTINNLNNNSTEQKLTKQNLQTKYNIIVTVRTFSHVITDILYIFNSIWFIINQNMRRYEYVLCRVLH